MSEELQESKNKLPNKKENLQASVSPSPVIKALDIPKQSGILGQPNKKQASALNRNAKIQAQKKQKKKSQQVSQIKKSRKQQIGNGLSKSQIKQSSLKPNPYIQKIFSKQANKSQYKKQDESSFSHNATTKIINKNKREISNIEKFPCSFCDKIITFEEIQSHHNSCQMAFTCDKCKDIFPIALTFQHQQVCQPNINKGQNNEPSYLKYYSKKEEHKVPRDQEIDQDELYQMQFIGQHPQIDPQILRQHLRAEKENRNYYHHSYPKEQQRAYDQNEQYSDNSEPREDLYFGEPESYSHSTIVQGLNENQIDELITDFYHRGDNNDEDECSVCSQAKEEGDIIIRLPCFHVFHKDCITPWLQVKSICPTCKFNLKSQ